VSKPKRLMRRFMDAVNDLPPIDNHQDYERPLGWVLDAVVTEQCASEARDSLSDALGWGLIEYVRAASGMVSYQAYLDMGHEEAEKRARAVVSRIKSGKDPMAAFLRETAHWMVYYWTLAEEEPRPKQVRRVVSHAMERDLVAEACTW
jgi:hypothetical protein